MTLCGLPQLISTAHKNRTVSGHLRKVYIWIEFSARVTAWFFTSPLHFVEAFVLLQASANNIDIQ